MARIRPSTPAAVFGNVLGLAILIAGLVQARDSSGGFIYLWFVAGLGIIGFTLWAAFAKNGATEVVEQDERR